jgi:hypothetical protein
VATPCSRTPTFGGNRNRNEGWPRSATPTNRDFTASVAGGFFDCRLTSLDRNLLILSEFEIRLHALDTISFPLNGEDQQLFS